MCLGKLRGSHCFLRDLLAVQDHPFLSGEIVHISIWESWGSTGYIGVFNLFGRNIRIPGREQVQTVYLGGVQCVGDVGILCISEGKS